MASSRILTAFGLSLALPFTAACGGAATPQETLRQYRDAIESEDQRHAWSLLSPEYRAQISEERFEADFGRRVDSGEMLIEQLSDAARNDASLTATLPYSGFETLELAFVGGRWVIVDGVGRLYSQSTPREALIAFIRAVQHENAEMLLRLVPSEYRAQMDVVDLAQWLDRRSSELDETLALLQEFGLALGMMVQLSDDCLDLAEDLANGTLTLPVLEGLARALPSA